MTNRKKHLTFYCMVILIGIAVGSSWGFSRKPPTPDVVPGRVLVKFHDGVDSERITEIVEAVGGTIKSVLTSTDVHIIILSEGVDVTEAVDMFTSYNEVEYAEPSIKATPLEKQ